MSLSIITNFICNFIVTALFPVFMDKIGGAYTFMIFAILCVLALIFVKFAIFETKNITLEEIEKRFS